MKTKHQRQVMYKVICVDCLYECRQWPDHLDQPLRFHKCHCGGKVVRLKNLPKALRKKP